MSAVATWLAAVSDAQQGSPDTGDGIAIIDGVVVAAVVVFALLVGLLSVARRRWRTRPDETHRYGDVGRIAGAGEASPEQRQGRQR
jgi:membrane protein required for beta-lactamase induction